jgi:hypothetical protein
MAEMALACLHESSSFRHLGANVVPRMSNNIASKDSCRKERSDKLHIVDSSEINDG